MIERLAAVLLVAVTVTSVDECGTTIPPNLVQQRQDVVNLCVERGGIPILNASGSALWRCEFPPVSPIIRLPEVAGQ